MNLLISYEIVSIAKCTHLIACKLLHNVCFGINSMNKIPKTVKLWIKVTKKVSCKENIIISIIFYTNFLMQSARNIMALS